jgi:hypothetical protein
MKRILSTIAGVAGILTATAGSPASAAGSPVRLVACDVSSVHNGGGAELIPSTAPFDTSNVRITFANGSPR